MHDPTQRAEGVFDGLDGTLLKGVEQVRGESVPQESLRRSLERAYALKRPRFQPRQRSRSLVAGMALVTTLLLGVFLCPTRPVGDDPALAERQRLEQVRARMKLLNDQVARARFEIGTPSDWAPIIPGLAGPGDVERTAKPLASHKEEVPRIVIIRGQDPRVVDEALEAIQGRDANKTRSGFSGGGSGGPGFGGGSLGRPGGFGGENRPRTSTQDSNIATNKPLADDNFSAYDVKGEGRRKIFDATTRQDEARKRLESLLQGQRRAPGSVSSEELRGAKLTLERAIEDARKDPSKEKSPQVWRRDGRQPTFARVNIGNGNALELVSLQVTVTIEGPRARTLVDHIFRNPHDRQLEGTFEYPLPTGASPSYFAMFLGQSRDTVPPRFARRGRAPSEEALARLEPQQLVRYVDSNDWGRLQEARVVGKEKALETYEDTVRGQIDPALLEHAGSNLFRGRVFPIPRKGYNRVLIAYEELLPVSQGRAIYRFPLADCELQELKFSLNANPAECKEPVFRPEKMDKSEGTHHLTYHRTWKKQGPGGDVLFTCTPPNPEVQAISGRHGESGPRYAYARLRPSLKTEKAAPFAENAVFLLDASLSEHSKRFDLSVKLMKKILESDEGLKRFNVVVFNVGAAWLEPKGWFDNTAAGREKALKRLDGLVLEGATDFSAALDKLAHPAFDVKAGTFLDVFVLSDGQITWGEPDVSPLVSRFDRECPFRTRFHCYRTGLGAENLELFESLTRRGGGVFNCFSDADLTAAAKAHRQQCWQIEGVRFVGGSPAQDVLVAGRKAAVYPGGEVVVAGRFNGSGRTTLVVEGTFLGKKYAQEYPIDVGGDSELAPRGWGEIAVASLLALNDPGLDGLVTAYCQEFGIGSRVASFLVLENDDDYKRLNLQAERGKTVPGDLSAFIEKVWAQVGQVLSPREALGRFLARVNPRIKALDGENGAQLGKLLSLLADRDFALPQASLDGALTRRDDVPASYLKHLAGRRQEIDPCVKEARRRLRGGDVAGAVRALSSIIEENPGNGDALRLVGYRLLDLGQSAQAARLFDEVRKQRPFEPHSYRDLARSLEDSGKYALAAVHYEVALAGTWHGRFGDSLKMVVREEYAHTLREAVGKQAVAGALADHFRRRLGELDASQPRADLRVTISWNTDATDVDLWVVEPDGTKCFYSHPRTESGGELSQDQTQGYGPERYQVQKARRGEYRVLVHYFRPNQNLLSGETHVNVVITRFAGTPQEVSERHTVILKKHDEAIEVTRIKF
ncbi:MAG: hypothetical protein HYS12_22720 [Planctomycetes bacterium]|nr:hypothetical protein [Planctomycetota bacterium]